MYGTENFGTTDQNSKKEKENYMKHIGRQWDFLEFMLTKLQNKVESADLFSRTLRIFLVLFISILSSMLTRNACIPCGIFNRLDSFDTSIRHFLPLSTTVPWRTSVVVAISFTFWICNKIGMSHQRNNKFNV